MIIDLSREELSILADLFAASGGPDTEAEDRLWAKIWAVLGPIERQVVESTVTHVDHN